MEAADSTPPQKTEYGELTPHRRHHPMHRHVAPIGEYIVIFIVLMLLLAATVGAAFIDLGRANAAVAYLIAIIKGVLIILFFMHVRHASRLTWVFSSAAFVWLGVLFVMTFNDYLTRPYPTGPGQPNPAIRSDRMSWPLPERGSPKYPKDKQ